jgi:hypothetical protein
MPCMISSNYNVEVQHIYISEPFTYLIYIYIYFPNFIIDY